MKAGYDYIIVGAGSSGCLLANRLSADPKQRVLLLEAGKADKDVNIHIPAAFHKLFRGKNDWNLDSEPQEYLKGRQVYQPRGKVLGGSSSINAMIYIRGHRADYDYWAALGNTGWSYDELLPFFTKMENNLRLKGDYHGQEGELTVSDHVEQQPLSKAFVAAAGEAGYPHNDDFNGEKQFGFGFYQVTIRNGERCSAAKAFLDPIKERENLDIVTCAQVEKIIIENKTATGVQFKHHGQTQVAHAAHEVVLCAGAFGSPQLLMLSGIGAAEELKAYGVEPIHHLPGVGKNLQDHLMCGIVKRVQGNQSMDKVEQFPYVIKNTWKYISARKGPLTSNIAESGGFVYTRPELEAPDLQFHFAPCFYIRHGFEKPSGNGMGLGPTLLCPKSRGEVTLNSADPFDKPKIDPRYYSDESDVLTMVRGYHIARKILAQPAFKPFIKGAFLPEKDLQRDEEVADFMRMYSETLYHPVGTCKMGTDELAVVDNQLRVRGIQQLRVADGSVMPVIVRGNTNAPCMMIAEKAAVMIQEKAD